MIFFFQAEDGIRDRNVTGVQTCALPICRISESWKRPSDPDEEKYQKSYLSAECEHLQKEIGRASCRERKERKMVKVLSRKTNALRLVNPSAEKIKIFTASEL